MKNAVCHNPSTEDTSLVRTGNSNNNKTNGGEKTMNKDLAINTLANRISTEVLDPQEKNFLFTDLYQLIEGRINKMVNRYMFKKNLQNFTFDTADYISAIGHALTEAVIGYDMNKGDFMGRLDNFAFRRMGNVTEYNLAEKRFDKSMMIYSVEEMIDADDRSYIIPDKKLEENTETDSLVSEFIASDKDGIVIDILRTVTELKDRNKAFTALYGKYTATERKRVQRVKERLSLHLTSNGVLI